MLLVAAISVVLLIVYFNIIKPLNYWKKKGLKHPKSWPVAGSMVDFILSRKCLSRFIQDLYNSFPKERCFGIYQFIQPTLVVRDLDLIKQITVKDFDSFSQHQTFVPEGIDSLWDNNLFAMKGNQRWHDMRSTLSPSFTSSKMKIMFNLIKECCNHMTDHFLKQNGTVTLEMKDTFRKFANDVIGTAAFGITCNSFENPNNEFFNMGQKLTDFSGLRGLIFLINGLSPTLMKIFNITVIQKSAAKFFRSIINEAITIRNEKGITRPDMIHLLMEAQKGRLKHDNENLQENNFAATEESLPIKSSSKTEFAITNEDITAQALVFFFAGFDTTSTLMGFMAYELAVNTDVQKKLMDEIDTTLEKCNSDVTYEALMGMKYLDMVVTETLRKWPPAEITDRNCVKDYVIQPNETDGKSINIDVNTNVWIPIYAIHRDPEYYPNPDKFDPERFNDENKRNIKPFSFLPFGTGPRSCIGSRFALLETKVAFFYILSKLEIVPLKKTQIPLRLKKGNLNMITEKGIWVGFRARNSM